jgi:hypothetical protein
MPDTQTLKTTAVREHDRPAEDHATADSRHAAAVEAAYILEAVRK